MIAQKKLYEGQLDCTFAWLTDGTVPLHICSQFMKCEAVRQQMLADLEDAYPRVQALECWPRRWSGKLCHWCERTAKRHHDMGRECVWRHLPRIFGFISWRDLELLEVRKVS